MSASEGCFPATRWTLIARLHSGDDAAACRALDELCAQYRYPLYCAIRHRGFEHHDAEDALHDFLAKLLRLDAFSKAEADKGRLRSFLSAALGRFLINWRRDRAGRGCEVSLDALAGDRGDGSPDRPAIEQRYLAERFSDHETPERIFDRQWARALLARVLDRLSARYAERGKSQVFAVLNTVLQRGGSLRGEDTPGLAAALGQSETALRKTHRRFLEDYGDLLEAEVFQTVASREEVADEIAHLQAAFRKK